MNDNKVDKVLKAIWTDYKTKDVKYFIPSEHIIRTSKSLSLTNEDNTLLVDYMVIQDLIGLYDTEQNKKATKKEEQLYELTKKGIEISVAGGWSKTRFNEKIKSRANLVVAYVIPLLLLVFGACDLLLKRKSNLIEAELQQLSQRETTIEAALFASQSQTSILQKEITAMRYKVDSLSIIANNLLKGQKSLKKADSVPSDKF